MLYTKAVALLVAFVGSTQAFAPVASKLAGSRAAVARAAPAQMFTVSLVMEDGSTSAIECSGDT